MSKTTRYWRNRLITAIQATGGYFSNHTRYPLEWTVHCMPDVECDTIRKSLVEGGWFIDQADLTLQYPDFDAWFEQKYGETPFSDNGLYSMAQEQVCDDLKDDDDGVRMWSPATAKKYGFDYVGDGAERPFDMELETQGRGGKHVVLTRFEGWTLTGMSNESMVEFLESMNEKGGNDYDNISNVKVRQLLGMIEELTMALTTENAEANALYYAADRVARDLEELTEMEAA